MSRTRVCTQSYACHIGLFFDITCRSIPRSLFRIQVFAASNNFFDGKALRLAISAATCLFALTIVSCQPSQYESPLKPSVTVSPPPKEKAKSAVDLLVNRSNNRGILIGGRGRFLDTETVIKNPTDHPIKILDVVNAKPCCGIVSFSPPVPTVLRPGDSATITVRLKLNESLGPLAHRTLITTNTSGDEPIEVWNYATVYPEISIEPKSSGSITVLPGSDLKVQFTIHSNGNDEVAPIPLDAILLRSNLSVHWLGDVVEVKRGDGLIEISREGEVQIPAGRSVGRHAEEVRVEFREQLKATLPILWETPTSIHMAPEALLFTAVNSQPAKVLLLRSTDDREFQLLGVESEHELVKATIERNIRKKFHRVEVVLNSASKVEKPFVLVIRTDHPDQPSVEVPCMILGKAE